jgi:hypothetical protein
MTKDTSVLNPCLINVERIVKDNKFTIVLVNYRL